jgi:holo-[acyl-carrier protein] synthase
VTRHEVGIDLIDVDRIVAVLDRYPDRFRQRILTPSEDHYCRGRPERIAGRWAAKEAVSKVLGLGVRGVGWREIEILPNRAGQPQVYLHGRASARAEAMGLGEMTVSISHERRMAVAVAMADRPDGSSAGGSPSTGGASPWR